MTLDRSKAPAVSDIAEVKIDKPELQMLPNGIKLYTLSGGEDSVCRLNVIIDGGMAETNPSVAATIIAKMLREGTTGRSSKEIADILDYNGAMLECSASTHHISLQLMALNRNFVQLVPLAVEIITTPAFPERETSIAIEEKARQLEIEREKVAYIANSVASQQAKGKDHPMAYNPTPEEIRALSASQLKSIYNELVSPAHINVFLAGNVTPEVKSAVVESFSSIATNVTGKNIQITPNAPMPPTREDVNHPGALQSAVVCTIPAIGRDHPDYIPLRIAVMALGGYFGSRLMANVREDKGYTYGISALLIGEYEGGFLKIMAQCDNRFVEPLIKEIRYEIERMATEPLTPEELTRVKRNYMTQLASRADSPLNMMSEVITSLLVGCPEDYFYKQQEVLSSITSDDIMRMSKKYLDLERMSIAVAGGEVS